MLPERRVFAVKHGLGIYQGIAFAYFGRCPCVSLRRALKAWVKGGMKEIKRVCYKSAYYLNKFHPLPPQTRTIGISAWMEAQQ